MNSIQDKLRMIMEGTLYEGDVVDGQMRFKERQYEHEIDKLQQEFDTFVDNLAQTIAMFARQRDSGQITQQEWLEKMNTLEARRQTMIDYNTKLQEMKAELASIRKNKHK